MSQAAAQQPSRKKAVISLLVLLVLTCIIVFTFKDHWAEITAALAQLSVWQVLAVLAVGLSYPLLEGCVAWVIVRSRLPQFTLRQGLDVGWCGTFGNVVTLGAGAVPVQLYYLHKAGLPLGPGAGLMTLEYVFHKSTVLLYATVMLLLQHRWLAANNVEIEAKGIAVGVRLEHPATLIDQIQYHNRNGRGKYLPAAEYSFVNQVDGRGVYSFCMCPGGFVVPAASGPEQIVVNGMSPSNRGSRWSNSGMVVELRPEDIEQFTIDNLQFTISMQHDSAANCQLPTVNSQLSMMYFQEYLERLCWQQGNMKQTAPAQRMADFTKKKLSYDLPETSYAPGLVSSPLHFWMPSFIAERLSKGFQLFGKYSRGFLTNEATMIGVETRTSAPVRITRDKETLQHVRVKGLFPCGEGAGYAGGIVSAGIDGERCAEAAKAFFD